MGVGGGFGMVGHVPPVTFLRTGFGGYDQAGDFVPGPHRPFTPVHPAAGAYTRPLFSSTGAVSDTKYTLPSTNSP